MAPARRDRHLHVRASRTSSRARVGGRGSSSTPCFGCTGRAIASRATSRGRMAGELARCRPSRRYSRCFGQCTAKPMGPGAWSRGSCRVRETSPVGFDAGASGRRSFAPRFTPRAKSKARCVPRPTRGRAHVDGRSRRRAGEDPVPGGTHRPQRRNATSGSQSSCARASACRFLTWRALSTRRPGAQYRIFEL